MPVRKLKEGTGIGERWGHGRSPPRRGSPRGAWRKIQPLLGCLPLWGREGVTLAISTIPAVAELIERQDRTASTMIYSNLSSPGPGSYSRAFSGKVNPLIIPEPGNQNPLVSGPSEETIQQDFVEIIFSKCNILEVLRMTGPGADYSNDRQPRTAGMQ
jgi:hypothetical protein